MPDVRNDAKWVQGMEVGGDYTYLYRTEEGDLCSVRLCVLAIHEPTCTVSILESEIVDESLLTDDQRTLLIRMVEVGNTENRIVHSEDADPKVVQ